MIMELNKEPLLIEQVKTATANYLIAKAIHETNKQIDLKSKKEALAEREFYNNDGERVTNPNRDYNIKDDDYKDFLILVDQKRRAKGLKLPYEKYSWAVNEPWNLTSDCESRPALKLAEDELIKAHFKIIPEELANELKKGLHMISIRKELIDTFLKLNLKELED